jgi:hypothetical protein
VITPTSSILPGCQKQRLLSPAWYQSSSGFSFSCHSFRCLAWTQRLARATGAARSDYAMEWSEYPGSAPGCSRFPYRRYLPRGKIGHLVSRGRLAGLSIAAGGVSCDLTYPFPPDLYTAPVMVEVRDRQNILERSADSCPVSGSLYICWMGLDSLGTSAGITLESLPVSRSDGQQC